MLKELDLVPRFLFSAILIGIGMSVAGFTSTMPWVWEFTFVFVFSVMWQYLALHYVLKRIRNRQRRSNIIFVWMIVATLIGGWSLNELANFDYAQGTDAEVVLQNSLHLLNVYGIGCAIFVAGVCARRAFGRYREL